VESVLDRAEELSTLPPTPPAFQNIVGASDALRAVVAEACKVASHSATTVLLQGESGTGKELFARGIHNSGANASEPFVPINCAAIPENLLESELFGHERGAFTGAAGVKKGLLEFAGSGTVFLDEIGEMPTNLQAKLLRVLEERKVRRVGSLSERDVECRIIAATNRDLAELSSKGEFREDLYYRLSVITLELPPLRARAEDIVPLARYFVEVLCREKGLPAKKLSAGAVDVIRGYNWPGNVRELRNTIERAVIMAESTEVLADHIVVRRRQTTAAAGAVNAQGIVLAFPPEGVTLDEAEKRLIEATLQLTKGNQTRAAQILGVSRPRLARKMEKYDLKA
jgi:two-component system response regulator AtoC